jgi:hypothetical protein
MHLKSMIPSGERRFETDECSIVISQVHKGRVLVVFQGCDRGKLGREPFQELEKNLELEGPLELFFDLHSAIGATLDVSGKWAIWLRANNKRLSRVSMLTGSPFVHLSAKAVKRFSELGDKLQLFSDPRDFAGALRATS